MKQKLLLAVAVLFGLFVTYVDTRPNWDDTAIIVFALLVGGGVIGLLMEKRPWLYALAVGLWLPLWYIISGHDPSMLVVLVFPFVGVYAAWVMRLGYHMLRHAE